MTNRQKLKKEKLVRRQARIRTRVTGTASRPRLSVFRSLRHITVQLIDDAKGVTLAAATDALLGAKADKLTPIEQAKAVGVLIGEKAKALGITQVVFDRGGRQYHGRVEAVAQGAREAGLTV